MSVHLFLLIKRGELDLSRCSRIVGEGSLDGVKIVCSDRDESASSAEIVVKLVLVVDERIVRRLSECHVS